MKVKNLLQLCVRHKLTLTLCGVLVTSIFGSIFYIQAVFGQDPIHQMLDTFQTTAKTTETAAPSDRSGVLAVERQTEDTSAAATQPATPEPPLPSPAQETAAVTTPAATAAPTTAPTVKPAATTAKPAKPTTAKPTTAKPTAAATTKPAATAAATTAASTAATTAALTPNTSGTYDSSMAREVLDLVNAQRTAAGLGSVSWNDSLAATAKIRASEIVVKWSHTRPNGESCFSIFPGEFGAVAENIAKGQGCASEVMTSWMASDGHRSNILKPGLTQLGVACYCVDGTYYWVQDFGG